jgi:hypothetical protein
MTTLLWHDVRYAVRGLRRKPAFAAAVVLTLGLGIGANATMFSVVDRLLFRPPAYIHAPDRVHRVNLAVMTDRSGEFINAYMSYKRYLELTEWTTSFDVTAAGAHGKPAIGEGENAREMDLSAISASFWRLFDMRPALGRFFTPAEDRVPDGTMVAVLGYGFWQTRWRSRRRSRKPVKIALRRTRSSASRRRTSWAPRSFRPPCSCRSPRGRMRHSGNTPIEKGPSAGNVPATTLLTTSNGWRCSFGANRG